VRISSRISVMTLAVSDIGTLLRGLGARTAPEGIVARRETSHVTARAGCKTVPYLDHRFGSPHFRSVTTRRL
jgi:hypothetical protein